jgi:tight adherence protein C
MRLAIISALSLWAGTTLVLSRSRWFSRPRLIERLRIYGPTPLRRQPNRGILSVASFGEVAGPLAQAIGGRVSRLMGVTEELALRLQRVHSTMDVTTFRVRQIGWAASGLGLAIALTAGFGPPLAVAALLLAGGPALAYLIVEQQLAGRSAAWQRRLFLELPVITEQLAMLLSAGYSLGAALNRLSDRGTGACAQDLQRVRGRIRQGLSEVEALREWAIIARVPALDRLVPVLALNREASDLGRLVSDEARSIRRDVHRELIETMERRGQQVWIPVTVATLVPGVVFLSIPFIEALRQFAGS